MANNPDEEVQSARKAKTAATVVSVQEPKGSIVVPISVTRRMKIYPIPEHELTMLQSLSSDKTFWSSVGSGAFALILGGLWDWCQLTTNPSTISKLIMAVLVLVCIFSFARSGWRKWSVNKRLEEILSESQSSQ